MSADNRKCAELRRRDAGGHPRMPKTTLGVNWSQVQILSAGESKQALTRDDAIVTQLNESKLGTIWGPQVPGEQFSGVGEGLPVGV